MDYSKPTFNDLENFALIYEDNEFFTQYLNKEIHDHADANVMSLKYSPTIEEFKIIEKIGSNFQRSLSRNYIQFFWPDNTGIRMEVIDYLQEYNYTLGKTYLMQALPHELKLKLNEQLTFEEVTSANFDLFNQVNEPENLKASQAYAEQAKLYYRYQFKAENVTGLLAYNKQEIVGSVVIISSKDHLEVDNLLTVTEFRKQKIASTILNEVKKMAIETNKAIILKADAEDYPHEIYQGMGFKIIASQISIKKDLTVNKYC